MVGQDRRHLFMTPCFQVSPIPEINITAFSPRKSCRQRGCLVLPVQSVSSILKIYFLSGVSYPERGYDLFLTAAVADGAKLWDLRQDRNPHKALQLPVKLCIFEVLDTVQLMDLLPLRQQSKMSSRKIPDFTAGVYERVYRLEIHSVMLVFSNQPPPPPR